MWEPPALGLPFTCADQYIHVCILQNVHEDSPIAADFPSSSNQDGLPVSSSNQNGSHVHFSSLKADEEESDTSEEIVPVVVRPGHIRFEPAGIAVPIKNLIVQEFANSWAAS